MVPCGTPPYLCFQNLKKIIMSQLTKQEAITLIKNFANNQSQITKEANSRRGVTKKSVKREAEIVKSLLLAMGVNDFNEDDILEATKF